MVVVEVRRCKCPHLIFKGKNLESFNNSSTNVLVDGKQFTLRKTKSGKDYIEFENIKDFPTGKRDINVYNPILRPVATGGCNCGVWLR